MHLFQLKHREVATETQRHRVCFLWGSKKQTLCLCVSVANSRCKDSYGVDALACSRTLAMESRFPTRHPNQQLCRLITSGETIVELLELTNNLLLSNRIDVTERSSTKWWKPKSINRSNITITR